MRKLSNTTDTFTSSVASRTYLILKSFKTVWCWTSESHSFLLCAPALISSHFLFLLWNASFTSSRYALMGPFLFTNDTYTVHSFYQSVLYLSIDTHQSLQLLLYPVYYGLYLKLFREYFVSWLSVSCPLFFSEKSSRGHWSDFCLSTIIASSELGT